MHRQKEGTVELWIRVIYVEHILAPFHSLGPPWEVTRSQFNECFKILEYGETIGTFNLWV